MKRNPPLWLMWVLIGAIVIAVSGGWSGAPWSAETSTAAARSSLKFLVGIAIVLVGAYLRHRASVRGRPDGA